MLLIGLFVLSLFMAIEVDHFNRFFDILVPVYALLVFVSIIWTVKEQRANKDSDFYDPSKRIYSLKKKVKNDNLSWKQKLAGTWSKIKREGFYEFMIFNGAPSLVAWAQKDADYGQIIEVKPDEKSIKVIATGFPPLVGDWVPAANTEAEAVYVPGKDPAGRMCTGACWWDEEMKAQKVKIDNPTTKINTLLIRQIDENDVLNLKMINTKQDGSSMTSETTFKRVS